MKRRDYEIIAAALASVRPRVYAGDGHSADAQHTRDVTAVACALKDERPAFDLALFMRNAGVQP